jgi:hypothetical protein
LANAVREVLFRYSKDRPWIPPCLFHAFVVAGHTLSITVAEIDVLTEAGIDGHEWVRIF